MPHRPVLPHFSTALPHFPAARKTAVEAEAAEPASRRVSTAVVGGGISGLIAARDLALSGLAVT